MMSAMKGQTSFATTGFHRAAVFLTAALTGTATVAALNAAFGGSWMAALAWASCVLVGAVALASRRKLPPLIGLSLLIAAMVNAAGYTLNLWHERTPFDEAVHAFTSFAAMAAATWVLLAGGVASWRTVIPLAIGMGIVAGLAWEAFEWLIGIVGDWRDTAIDVLMDAAGAFAGGIFVRRIGERTAGTSSLEVPRHAELTLGAAKEERSCP